MSELTVGPVEELPPGEVKIVRAGELAFGVYNLNGEYYAIEDRCSHDDGPLAEGDFDVEEAVAICPPHGARFDIKTGRALSLHDRSVEYHGSKCCGGACCSQWLCRGNRQHLRRL